MTVGAHHVFLSLSTVTQHTSCSPQPYQRTGAHTLVITALMGRAWVNVLSPQHAGYWHGNMPGALQLEGSLKAVIVVNVSLGVCSCRLILRVAGWVCQPKCSGKGVLVWQGLHVQAGTDSGTLRVKWVSAYLVWRRLK